MNYTQAVQLAKEGKEEGFNFLYEDTYKSKYYLALKYMQNEEAAKDVLQDAYIRAFSKLDMLDNPEAFSGWLGIIVANTAKNALQKKKPMLFSDIMTDEENESLEYQIEDENTQSQPEIAYTRQETQELVQELISSLSEEQRMCILMFHIEGESISEIAEALNCSENTVKSRLNYGRKNLKVKAEELQKKGYKLYSIAPTPLLVYLLMSEKKSMAAEGALEFASHIIAKNVAQAVNASSSAGMSAGAGNAAKAGIGTATKAAKSGFIHTVAGKITAAAIGICITGGTVAVGVSIWNSGEETAEVVNEQEEDDVSTEELVEEVEEKDEFRSVTDDMYPSLLAGNLTKEQLCYVLATTPGLISESGMSTREFNSMMNFVAMGHEELDIRFYGHDDMANNTISAEDTNRILSVITNYKFTEENDIEKVRGSSLREKVQGDNLKVCVADGLNAWVEILDAEYKSDEMWIEYEHTRHTFSEEGDVTQKRLAILRPQEDGLYQIKQIWTIQEDSDIEKIRSGAWDWKMAYRDVLLDAPNQTYDAGSGLVVKEPKISYYLSDIQGDSVPELIVTATSGTDGAGVLSFRNSWVGIYSYNKETGVRFVGKDIYYMPGFAKDEANNQLIIYSVDPFNGNATYYSIQCDNAGIHETEIYSGQFPSFDYETTFNSEHGFTVLKHSDREDFSVINKFE